MLTAAVFEFTVTICAPQLNDYQQLWDPHGPIMQHCKCCAKPGGSLANKSLVVWCFVQDNAAGQPGTLCITLVWSQTPGAYKDLESCSGSYLPALKYPCGLPTVEHLTEDSHSTALGSLLTGMLSCSACGAVQLLIAQLLYRWLELRTFHSLLDPVSLAMADSKTQTVHVEFQ